MYMDTMIIKINILNSQSQTLQYAHARTVEQGYNQAV